MLFSEAELLFNSDKRTGYLRDSLSILGTSKQNSLSVFVICHKCGEDKELYGDGIFQCYYTNLLKGCCPCGCSKSYKKSSEQSSIIVTRKAFEKGIIFHGFSGNFANSKTKLILECPIHGTWNSTSIVTFTTRKNNCCKDCGASFVGKINKTKSLNNKSRRLDESIMIERFESTGRFVPGTTFKRIIKAGKSRWSVYCPVCGDITINNGQLLEKGCLPCSCSSYKQNYAYLNIVYEDNLPVALKFGITSTFKERFYKLSWANKNFNFKNFGVWYFHNYSDCIESEKEIKSTLNCSIISKNLFPDGHTETTPIYNLDKVVKIFENRFGIRVDV